MRQHCGNFSFVIPVSNLEVSKVTSSNNDNDLNLKRKLDYMCTLVLSVKGYKVSWLKVAHVVVSIFKSEASL